MPSDVRRDLKPLVTALAAEGLTAPRIAERLEVTRSRVYQVAQANGITLPSGRPVRCPCSRCGRAMNSFPRDPAYISICSSCRRADLVEVKCPYCLVPMRFRRNVYEARRKRAKHGLVFGSHACAQRYFQARQLQVEV